MNKSINEKISELRKARALTQEQLGTRLGITAQAVSKWENSESLPDILILPELCDILGISVDALLEMPASLKNKNIMKDFCEYAKEQGVSKTLLEALSRLFNNGGNSFGGKNVDFGPDRLKVYDGRGMGFIMSGEKYRNECIPSDGKDIAYFLEVLSDETCLAVIRCISIDSALTKEEICETSGIDEKAADGVLVRLMERNVICRDVDVKGKRGYLQSANMAGVYMVLAGCRSVGFGGQLNGNSWFTRSNTE